MTREEARKRAELMLAFADGKQIEFFDEYIGDWAKDDNPVFNWGINVYRIKKEPTYRPFKDKDECWAEMQKHQPFGWVIENDKDNKYKSLITTITESYAYTPIEGWTYEKCLEKLTFADGTPFGIKEE